MRVVKMPGEKMPLSADAVDPWGEQMRSIENACHTWAP